MGWRDRIKDNQEPEDIEEDLDDEDGQEDDSKEEEEMNKEMKEKYLELVDKGVRLYTESLLKNQLVENVKIIVKLSDGSKITHEK